MKPESQSETRIDPRVRRTRQRLHESLLHLAVERGYDAVTVQDVLNHSETARSTFYAHFRDKDDLFFSGFGDSSPPLFEALFEADVNANPFANFTQALFDHVYQNRALATAFFGSSVAPLIMGHLRNLIVVEARKLLAGQGPARNLAAPDELRVQFVAGASFSLMTWWIDHDFPYSVQEMSEACQQFITAGVGRELAPEFDLTS
ncbi:MAG: TetR/AcrR family transcriptional regulator [Pseudomonadota bacterium]